MILTLQHKASPLCQYILYFIFCFLYSIKRCGGWLCYSANNGNGELKCLFWSRHDSVSFVNRQIGHCLTRMERVTNIEQEMVNMESNGRITISDPIILGSVWPSSLRVALSDAVVFLVSSVSVSVSTVQVKSGVAGCPNGKLCWWFKVTQYASLCCRWDVCLVPRQRRETLRRETKDNTGYADWFWKEI